MIFCCGIGKVGVPPGQPLGGILHPDYSHSPVASVAINEQEPEGSRTEEAGSAMAAAGLESSPGGGLGNNAYVLSYHTLFCDIFRLLCARWPVEVTSWPPQKVKIWH